MTAAADLPLPAGANWADEWEDDDTPWRLVTGAAFGLGLPPTATIVRAVAVQYADGSIDLSEADGPRVDVVRIPENGFRPIDARSLARLIVGAADQADAWIAEGRRHGVSDDSRLAGCLQEADPQTQRTKLMKEDD